MSVRWRYADQEGRPAGESEAFASRQEAEDWMKGEWETLLASEVYTVTLVDGQDSLYEMKLTEE